jgi:electron transfer flavoprotein alpha subunit
VIALVPVRDGEPADGGAEAVAECRGRAVLVGSGVAAAVPGLVGVATDVRLWEAGPFRPGAWAATMAPVLADEPVVVLPGSADGRDLAPLLAHAMGRPLLAGAMAVEEAGASVSRWGGLAIEDVVAREGFVATFQPGVRGVDPRGVDARGVRPPSVDVLDLRAPEGIPDATALEVLPPDPATMDLAEASRIVAGGAGLESAERFEQLAAVAAALGASVGATRVVTDRGWLAHERQIGTTGVVVDPRLYVAFGISGAVQHTSGLGDPEHVISVNTDPHCPMMQLADLAIVSDANAVLDELLMALHRTRSSAHA